MTLPTYRSLTSLPEPISLTTWRASLVRPITRTNLVTNPSAETATTGYTASGGSIARSTTESFHGAYSIAVTPTAATTDGVYYLTSSLTSGTTYAVSVKIKVPNAAGRPYRLAFATTAGVMLQTKTFTATGLWQWVTLTYAETSTTTRRIYITKNGGAETAVFYVDGLQVEACESGNWFATTYIDGDQDGLLGELESSPAYYWTGIPHASTSVRSGQTRAGGQVVNLANYGFLLSAIIGLGMAPVEPITTPFGQLDGAQFLDQRNASRSFVLNGRWAAPSARAQDRQMATLQADIGRDYVATRQPMTIMFEPLHRGEPIRAPIAVPGVSYVGGLEGAIDGLPVADTPIAFTQYIPLIIDSEDGVALDVQDSITTFYTALRTPAGAWQAMGTDITGVGLGSTLVRAAVFAPDGYLYIGGDFSAVGGVANTIGIARWNVATGAWEAVGTGGAASAIVTALALAPDGDVYAVGDFTAMGGAATSADAAVWDITAGAWTGLNRPAAVNSIQCVVVAPNGTVYVGADTGAPGTLRSWVPSTGTWTTVGTASVGGGAAGLAIGLDGDLYITGAFTTFGGVASTNFIKYTVSTTPSAPAFVAITGNTPGGTSLTFGLDGSLYAAHSTTTNLVTRFRGQAWEAIGLLGTAAQAAQFITTGPDGLIYVAGSFTTAGIITLPDAFAIWNGATMVALDINFPTALSDEARVIAVRSDGYLFAGRTNLDTANPPSTGTATVAGTTTATNTGTVVAYPKLILNGPSSGTARAYSIRNTTTNQTIYLNLTLNVGEQVVINFDPANLSAVSSFRGNVLSAILPGSDFTDFGLQPGANTITAFVDSSTATATLTWTVASGSLADGWTR